MTKRKKYVTNTTEVKKNGKNELEGGTIFKNSG